MLPITLFFILFFIRSILTSHIEKSSVYLYDSSTCIRDRKVSCVIVSTGNDYYCYNAHDEFLVDGDDGISNSSVFISVRSEEEFFARVWFKYFNISYHEVASAEECDGGNIVESVRVLQTNCVPVHFRYPMIINETTTTRLENGFSVFPYLTFARLYQNCNDLESFFNVHRTPLQVIMVLGAVSVCFFFLSSFLMMIFLCLYCIHSRCLRCCVKDSSYVQVKNLMDLEDQVDQYSNVVYLSDEISDCGSRFSEGMDKYEKQLLKRIKYQVFRKEKSSCFFFFKNILKGIAMIVSQEIQNTYVLWVSTICVMLIQGEMADINYVDRQVMNTIIKVFMVSVIFVFIFIDFIILLTWSGLWFFNPLTVIIVISAYKEWFFYRATKVMMYSLFFCLGLVVFFFGIYQGSITGLHFSPHRIYSSIASSSYILCTSFLIPEFLIIKQVVEILLYDGFGSLSHLKKLEKLHKKIGWSFDSLYCFPPMKRGFSFLTVMFKRPESILEDVVCMCNIIQRKEDILKLMDDPNFKHLSWDMLENLETPEIHFLKEFFKKQKIQRNKKSDIYKLLIMYISPLTCHWWRTLFFGLRNKEDIKVKFAKCDKGSSGFSQSVENRRISKKQQRLTFNSDETEPRVDSSIEENLKVIDEFDLSDTSDEDDEFDIMQKRRPYRISETVKDRYNLDVVDTDSSSCSSDSNSPEDDHPVLSGSMRIRIDKVNIEKELDRVGSIKFM